MGQSRVRLALIGVGARRLDSIVARALEGGTDVVIGAGVVGLATARALALAGREVLVLEAQRRLGEESYPLSLERLRQLTGPEATADLVKKALAHPSLKDKLVLVNAKEDKAPVALTEEYLPPAEREIEIVCPRGHRKIYVLRA